MQCTLLDKELSILTTTAKRMHNFDNSYMLLHKRLGHISKDRIMQLSKLNFIPALDFNNASECIDCMKGKTTNVRKMDANRSKNLLEIIRTDACGPFLSKPFVEIHIF